MRGDVRWLGSRSIAATFMVATVALAGCGESRSAADSVSSARLGLECGDVRAVSASEVDVDDDVPECEAGYCLHGADVARGAKESPGMCSCRCDGEPGTGPFCTCGDGFVCREEVHALGLSPPALSGSYCVPKR